MRARFALAALVTFAAFAAPASAGLTHAVLAAATCSTSTVPDTAQRASDATLRGADLLQRSGNDGLGLAGAVAVGAGGLEASPVDAGKAFGNLGTGATQALLGAALGQDAGAGTGGLADCLL